MAYLTHHFYKLKTGATAKKKKKKKKKKKIKITSDLESASKNTLIKGIQKKKKNV